MEIHEYLGLKKQLCSLILQFIENDDDNQNDFNDLTNFIDKNKYTEDKGEILDLLNLIEVIASNHYRNLKFIENIEKIILYLATPIKQTLSNKEIFNIFKNDKRTLLYLFEKKIIIIDDEIVELMLFNPLTYFNYFFNVIESSSIDKKRIEMTRKSIISMNPNILNNFEKKQKIGENESYICQLIRNDSIEEFVAYINRQNIELSATIKFSLFETNPLLISKSPSLIEYAAFFGSSQIFQYLKNNNAKLTPSLWIYAIHGRNPMVIDMIVNENIQPEDKSYLMCLKEAMKCHHNEIAEYIRNNFLDEEKIKFNYTENCLYYSFKYHNYEYISIENDNENNEKNSFFYSVEFNYFELVKLLLKYNKANINEIKCVLNLCIEIYIVQKKISF